MKSSALTDSQQQVLLEGISAFNQGQYYDCHEILEALWMDLSGANKRWVQGLIQLAVACYHASRHNYKGAASLTQAAEQKLIDPPCPWIETEALCTEIRVYLKALSHWKIQPPSADYLKWKIKCQLAD